MIYSRNDWNLKDSRRFFWLPQEILQNSANFSKKTKHVSLLLWFYLIVCSAQKTHSIIIFRFARIKFINLKLIFSFFSFCTAAISTVDKMPVLKPTIHWPQMRCWLPIVSVTQTWVSNSNTIHEILSVKATTKQNKKNTNFIWSLYGKCKAPYKSNCSSFGRFADVTHIFFRPKWNAIYLFKDIHDQSHRVLHTSECACVNAKHVIGWIWMAKTFRSEEGNHDIGKTLFFVG